MKNNRGDEEGPRIHRTQRVRDRIDKHKNAIYDLVDEEESDLNDDGWSPLPPPTTYVMNGPNRVRF